MFKIENNIPIKERPLLGATDFLRTLEIGQSFLIPFKSRNAMHQIAKRCGIKIKTEKENDKARIWRIE